MRTSLYALLFLLASGFPAAPLTAQDLCPADELFLEVSADTVFVEHWNAERNCCFELAVQFTAEANTIDFYEGATGDPCRCDCCFNLRYSACGFSAGTYTVRVWNEDGTELYGSVEVEVGGAADAPDLVAADLGQCVGPTPSSLATWGLVKEIYR